MITYINVDAKPSDIGQMHCEQQPFFDHIMNVSMNVNESPYLLLILVYRIHC